VTVNCLKCGTPVIGAARLVMGRGKMERLCPGCGELLSALVQAAGDTCQLSLGNERFVAWLETGRWTARDGRLLGPEDLPGGWHAPSCPCCATFQEEEE
jgi:hypothetical protein